MSALNPQVKVEKLYGISILTTQLDESQNWSKGGKGSQDMMLNENSSFSAGTLLVSVKLNTRPKIR